MLNNNDTIQSLQDETSNVNSLRGLDVDNNNRTTQQFCVDNLPISTDVDYVLVGGQSWKVQVRRRNNLNVTLESSLQRDVVM